MSSYSLKGGPRLVDYRIALTDQRELWLLSNSLSQRKVSSERAWVGFFKHMVTGLLLIIPS